MCALPSSAGWAHENFLGCYIWAGLDLRKLKVGSKFFRRLRAGCSIVAAPKKVLDHEGGPMLDITKDIQSLTTFRRRSGDFMKQLRKSKRPVVLTVKGKAAAVVLDAEAYQRLLDIAARADVEEGIRQGLNDLKKNKMRPAREFFNEFEVTHGTPR
jgi:prevent-host-death family protein